MAKKWHPFENGKQYPLNQILETCTKHIESGGVADKDGKRKYLQQIRDCGQSELVYKRESSGWGNSPLNPNSWRMLDGQFISGASRLPKYYA